MFALISWVWQEEGFFSHHLSPLSLCSKERGEQWYCIAFLGLLKTQGTPAASGAPERMMLSSSMLCCLAHGPSLVCSQNTSKNTNKDILPL